MRLSSIFGLALVSLLVVVAVVDIYSFQTHPRIIAVLRAAFGEASSSSLSVDAPNTGDGSESEDSTGGFKPLKEWTTSELAAFVERGGHRELREVWVFVHDSIFPCTFWTSLANTHLRHALHNDKNVHIPIEKQSHRV